LQIVEGGTRNREKGGKRTISRERGEDRLNHKQKKTENKGYVAAQERTIEEKLDAAPSKSADFRRKVDAQMQGRCKLEKMKKGK